MINENRARECFWLFSNTLPIGKNQTDALIKNMGANIAPLLPELFSKFSQVCLKYPEEFDGYLDLIKNMIDYIREETDVNPIESIDINEDERSMMLKHMEIQIGKSE